MEILFKVVYNKYGFLAKPFLTMKKGVSLLETVVAISMSAIILLMLSTFIRTYFRLESNAVNYAKINNEMSLVKDYISESFQKETSYKDLLGYANYITNTLESIDLENSEQAIVDDEITLQAKQELINFKNEVLANPDSWFIYDEGVLKAMNQTLLIKIRDFNETHVFSSLLEYYQQEPVGYEYYQAVVNNLNFDDMKVIFRKNDNGYRYCKILYSYQEMNKYLKFSLFKDTTNDATRINLDVTDPTDERYNYDLFSSRYNSVEELEEKQAYGLDYLPAEFKICYVYGLEGQEEKEYCYDLALDGTGPIVCNHIIKTDDDTDEQYHMVDYTITIGPQVRTYLQTMIANEIKEKDKNQIPDIVMDNVYIKAKFINNDGDDNAYIPDVELQLHTNTTYSSLDKTLPTYRSEYKRTDVGDIEEKENALYRLQIVVTTEKGK